MHKAIPKVFLWLQENDIVGPPLQVQEGEVMTFLEAVTHVQVNM